MAAVLFGPGAGALVGSAACWAIAAARGRSGRSTRATAPRPGVVAGLAAALVTDSWSSTCCQSLLVASAAAAAGLAVVDFTVNMITARLRKNLRPIDVWRLLRGSLGLTFALYTPLMALYAYAYLNAGVLVIAFIAIPLLAAHLSHSMFARQAAPDRAADDGQRPAEDANAAAAGQPQLRPRDGPSLDARDPGRPATPSPSPSTRATSRARWAGRRAGRAGRT